MRIDLGLQQTDLRIAFFFGKLLLSRLMKLHLPDQRKNKTDKGDEGEHRKYPEIDEKMAIRSAFGHTLRPRFSGEVSENKDINIKEYMTQQSKEKEVENQIKYKTPLFKKARKYPETVQIESHHTQDCIQAGKHQCHLEG